MPQFSFAGNAPAVGQEIANVSPSRTLYVGRSVRNVYEGWRAAATARVSRAAIHAGHGCGPLPEVVVRASIAGRSPAPRSCQWVCGTPAARTPGSDRPIA
jgi:hypothetical protein